VTSERLLGLLGLGVRAGAVVIGVEATRRALQRGTARCVVVAGDASERARGKVMPLARGRGVPVLAGPSADVLGQRCGRPAVHAVAVEGAKFAEGLLGGTSRAED